ncbi:hypothetical protein Rhe02_78190 [Rhizocola hellebori]|uniref:Peptidase S8/S53 domain-containing protein n=1 Tax=Rhizocola hellebori TaxID=1392758 RepID=A0A8J3QGQ9_9ACTN|nr:S8 family serine peptidase [Rhizocola hellebori]GIH09752.1 hypothetical protein Rhe02_78190 [Rhizocola hellebori]
MSQIKWFHSGVVALMAATAAWLPAPASGQGGTDQVVVIDQIGAPGSGTGRTRQEVRVTSGTVPAGLASKSDGGPENKQRGPIVSPQLRTLVQSKGAIGTVKIVVGVADTVTIPEFPAKADGESAAMATARQDQAQILVDRIRAQREPANNQWRTRVARAGGRIIEEFWLVQGFVAEVPVAAVEALAAEPGVRSVTSADTVVPFPVDSDPGNDLSVARSLMGTDVFRSFGSSNDTIALIDSGVNSHVLLPSTGVVVVDMVNRNPKITADICDHGTRSVTAMAGSNALGDGLRGITDMRVRVYHTGVFGPLADGTTGCGTDLPAAVASFGRAVQDGMKMIVAEMQMLETPDSPLDQAADSAFRSGAVVVAAAGNFGGGVNSVRAPANARNVLGIGSVDVKTFVAPFPQGKGPTEDGRYKPDLVVPTNYEAGRGTSTTATGVFTGTSGATAAAGGTAAALRAYLKGGNSTVDPGRVYATLIAGGSRPQPFDGVDGAGKLKLHTGQTFTFAVTVNPGGFVDVPIDLAASSCRLSASLWWPAQASGPTNADNDVDLEVRNPVQQLAASSISGPSVFELARVDSTMGGRWTMRVKSFSMASSQLVYGAVTTCR